MEAKIDLCMIQMERVTTTVKDRPVLAATGFVMCNLVLLFFLGLTTNSGTVIPLQRQMSGLNKPKHAQARNASTSSRTFRSKRDTEATFDDKSQEAKEAPAEANGLTHDISAKPDKDVVATEEDQPRNDAPATSEEQKEAKPQGGDGDSFWNAKAPVVASESSAESKPAPAAEEVQRGSDAEAKFEAMTEAQHEAGKAGDDELLGDAKPPVDTESAEREPTGPAEASTESQSASAMVSESEPRTNTTVETVLASGPGSGASAESKPALAEGVSSGSAEVSTESLSASMLAPEYEQRTNTTVEAVLASGPEVGASAESKPAPAAEEVHWRSDAEAKSEGKPDAGNAGDDQLLGDAKPPVDTGSVEREPTGLAEASTESQSASAMVSESEPRTNTTVETVLASGPGSGASAESKWWFLNLNHAQIRQSRRFTPRGQEAVPARTQSLRQRRKRPNRDLMRKQNPRQRQRQSPRQAMINCLGTRSRLLTMDLLKELPAAPARNQSPRQRPKRPNRESMRKQSPRQSSWQAMFNQSPMLSRQSAMHLPKGFPAGRRKSARTRSLHQWCLPHPKHAQTRSSRRFSPPGQVSPRNQSLTGWQRTPTRPSTQHLA
eukprot:TRINITY_DN2443_c0_g1_i5.p1 TRINITY_DN2443_c0_g1~~TRINITY_DN2443_c0_g1_i5.p1  ORF type:complete len:632 (+),score=92.25 TRINITY_DN2443_c0_g1_i5:78-1898(+)